jgi:predicted metal-dependent phosphoesterase TrpH
MLLDLHVHTSFSFDSFSSPDGVLRSAKRAGLDGLAVTDHDTIDGALETRERNRDRDLIVIVGCEKSTDAGDIIGLFLREAIRSRAALEVIREIHEQGGLALLPHPFHGRSPRDDVVAAVDLLEVFNARTSADDNDKARALADRLGKRAVCSSDAHFASDVGTCRVLVDGADPRTALLRGARALHTRYTPRYKTSASQIIKAWKRGNYTAIPVQCASMIKRVVAG